MNERYSPEDVLASGRNIYQVRENYYAKDRRISEITVKEQKLLAKLGVKLT